MIISISIWILYHKAHQVALKFEISIDSLQLSIDKSI